MSITRLEQIALGLSGLTAFAVGASILVAPHIFFASYGITLNKNVSLLSELRAPAAGLVACGVLMLVGIWRASMRPVSKVLALVVFLGFPAGRIMGLIVDGVPSGPIIGALMFELAVALLCLVAFGRRLGPAQGSPLNSLTQR